MRFRGPYWRVLLLTAAVCGPANAADSQTQTSPTGTPTPTSRPAAPQLEDFATRRQRLQEQQQRQQSQEAAQRPTGWQIQNPSNPSNRIATRSELSGYVAPNTYYGPQFRDWSHQSPPVTQSERPGNITPVPLLEQTGAQIAPYSYWGPENARSSHVTIGRAEPDPLGGWRLRPGR